MPLPAVAEIKSSSNECFFVDLPTLAKRVDDDVDEAICGEADMLCELILE